MTEQIRRVRAAEPGAQVERRSLVQHRSGRADDAMDVVAVEEPLEIRIDHGPEGSRTETSISITMRTPGADPELAVGFLFGEGLIGGSADVRRAESHGPLAPGRSFHNVVRIDLAPEVGVAPERLLRHFYTTSSCGVCGKASLDALRQQPRLRVDASADAGTDAKTFEIDARTLEALPEAIVSAQETFLQTGGLHGAGLFDSQGCIESVYEDVGRHNALDKLVGSAVLAGTIPWRLRGVLLSGRASFELLQKAMMAGAPLVAAIGAPSSLAIDLAEEFGITLVGFLRRGGFNVYTSPQRVRA